MAWGNHALFSIVGAPRTRAYKQRQRRLLPNGYILPKQQQQQQQQRLIFCCIVMCFTLWTVARVPVWPVSKWNNNDNGNGQQEPRTCQEFQQFLTNNSKLRDPLPIYENAPSVLVFFHITKTGGTSIRSFGTTQLLDAASYVAGKPGDHTRVDRLIQRYLQNKGNAPTLFVEFHGQGLEVGRLAKDMVVWRHLQEQFRTNLFLFTVFRHPVDHAVSHYHALMNHTDSKEESMDLSQEYSRQCAMFVPPTTTPASSKRGASSFGRRQPMTPHACWEAYRSILSHMDWVGTTERIDTETIPRLQAWHSHSGVDVGLTESNTTMSHKNVGSWRKDQSAVDSTSRHALERSILQLACEDYVLWEHYSVVSTVPTRT